VDILTPFFQKGEFVMQALAETGKMDHIMVFTEIRVLTSLFSLIRKGINMIIEYNEHHEDFPLKDELVEKFITKQLVFGICWSFGGDMHLRYREEYCNKLPGYCAGIDMPSGLGPDSTLLDFEARIDDGEWYHWRDRVPVLDIEPEQVGDGSLICPTIDTVRHVVALGAWLEERRPFILSGPPGSGKTMTLMSTLKGMANSCELASLNFSAGTTPELLLQTFDVYCETVKTPSGLLMRPLQLNRWVVVFCDECNLPTADKYSTQKVIMFIRQITEYGGFYRPSDRQWVRVERVQFLGACNPPTDPGRHPMSDRFLRHSPVIWVDYPGVESLKQIYGTFNRGMMKLQQHLPREIATKMTNVMVQFWAANSKQFTSDMQPHYLYSPRELTRWKIALHEAIQQQEGMTEETLIRLVMHEALRIFVDRIVFAEEKEWAEAQLDDSVKLEFGCDDSVIKRPILFSCYLNPEAKYLNVTREDLRECIQAKLKVFYEEELAVKLCIFDGVLDHIVRMDRVLRQPLGHLLLVGASGTGKTVLSKFVSWMNGLKVYSLKIGKGYDVVAFENDLRVIMKRSGVKKEKITFIFDESNALGPAFLERMNALLAAGEVPGLFEGDEYANLMSECRSAGGMSGMDESEMFAKFTKQVQRNLHIVFTMNPANPDFYNRSNSSPALFNRCIIDWFGDWPRSAFIQVGSEFTNGIHLSEHSFNDAKYSEETMRHDCLAETIVAFHERVEETNEMLQKAAMKYNFITPRDFLDFVNHFLIILDEKREEVLESKGHIEGGLQKLRETEEQVNGMQAELAKFEVELAERNKVAEETMTQMVKGQSEAEEVATDDYHQRG
jgi:dynein heavy chain 1